MEKELIQIGSSLAIIIPHDVVKTVHLKKGDIVDIEADETGMRIQRRKKLMPVNLYGAVSKSDLTLEDIRSLRGELGRGMEKKWKDL